jgi:phenylalanyl-tRNA synthetase alpha chain
MWPYYLRHKGIIGKLEKEGKLGLLSTGIVFRKDEIDRKHFPAFHQIDGLYICRKSDKILVQKDLEDVLVDVAQSVFGKDIEYKFAVDTFPFTDPSVEMNLKWGDDWMEILGSGLVHYQVLKNLGVDPEIYNGWAFGFGLERLAIASMELPDIRLLWSGDERVKKQLRLGNKFKEVSKFPPITRDISFVVDKNFVPNNYFDLIRDLGRDLVEEVKLLDKYENAEKFGPDKISYTYRIVYRSNERTLEIGEIEPIQDKIYQETKSQFKAEIR